MVSTLTTGPKQESKAAAIVSLIVLTLLLPTGLDMPAAANPSPLGAEPVLATGPNQTFALGSDGTLLSFGANSNGVLGIGSQVDKSRPTAVAIPDPQIHGPVVDVSGGVFHFLAVTSDGKIWAWGRNDYGQLGNGLSATELSPVLVDLSNLSDGVTFSAVAAGEYHSLALSSDGKLFSWGRNNSGQLGTGDLVDRNTPHPVTTSSFPAGTKFTAIAAGLDHSLAISSTGQIFAWGTNVYGQLGDASNTNRITPIAVDTTNLAAGVTFSAIVASNNSSLALATDGNVFGWGNNSSGQLGDGTKTNRNLPTKVVTQTPTSFSQVAMGWYHALAIDAGGVVLSWGWNNLGQLGDGTTVDRLTPTAVAEGELWQGLEFRAISAGAYHSVAISKDGFFFGWGRNYNGQLGTGSYENQVLEPKLLQNRMFMAPNLSSDSALYDLQLSAGTLNPQFSSNVTSYTVNLEHSVESISLTPTTDDLGAQIRVNGQRVSSGAASALQSLSVGTTQLSVVVTAANNTTTTYTIDLTRAPAPVQAVAPQPAVYLGPVPASVSPHGTVAGTEVTVFGRRMDSIHKALIEGTEVEIVSKNADSIAISIPKDVKPGKKDLVFESAHGTLTFQGALEVLLETEVAVQESTAQKANVGSFGGRVVVYAKGYEGQRISWKIGGKWHSENVTKSFDNFSRRAGLIGQNVAVLIYFDGELAMKRTIKIR